MSAVTAAVVVPAVIVTLVVMVVAVDIGIKGQLPRQQGLHSLVCVAGSAAVELDRSEEHT